MNLWEETENRYSDDEKILTNMKQTVLDLEKKKIEKEYEYETFMEDEKPRYFVDDDKPIGRPYHDDD